jgi:hypothetical protein
MAEKLADTPNSEPPIPKLNCPIEQLPGLSLQDQTQLLACGIQTTRHLLQATQTPTQQQALAAQLHTRIQRVQKWSALTNLSQIPAVGCQYCGLLLHVGITSPAQLAQTPLPKLHQQILKLQVATMQRPDLCPNLGQISEWIEQAQQMSRKPISRKLE